MKRFYLVVIYDDGSTKITFHTARATAQKDFDARRELAQYSMMQWGVVGERILGRAVCENVG